MQYLVDAQLPVRLRNWLNDNGYDSIHTRDLPKRNNTPDSEIIHQYASNEVVVISKDKDFPQQRLINGKPEKLLWITTGNIVNDALMKLFAANFADIDHVFSSGNSFLEMDNVSVIVHE